MLNWMPGFVQSGSRTMLVKSMPKTIAINTPEMGLALPVGSMPWRRKRIRPAASAKGIANPITAALNKTPGRRDGTCCHRSTPNNAKAMGERWVFVIGQNTSLFATIALKGKASGRLWGALRRNSICAGDGGHL
jgi:hypothetical protein